MITVEAQNLEPIIKTMSQFPNKLKTATRKSIRATMRDAKTDAANLAKKRYTLPASIVRSSLSISVSGMNGTLKSTGRRNPLEKAKTTPSGRINTRGRYIKAEVVRGQGGLLKRAFRKNSGQSIFQRLTINRFPIKKLSTVSAPGMVSHPEISEPLQDKMIQRFSMNFLREAAAVLG